MTWKFDNSYIYLPEKLFSAQKPTPVRSPKLEVINYSLAKSLGLDPMELESIKNVEVFAIAFGKEINKDRWIAG